jgi:hypothetical protein
MILDYASVTTRLKRLNLQLDDALLYRNYSAAIHVLHEIESLQLDLAEWLGSVKDGDFVSCS